MQDVEYVLEVELPEERLQSDGKKVVVKFNSLEKAQKAVKLYRTTTTKEVVNIQPPDIVTTGPAPWKRAAAAK